MIQQFSMFDEEPKRYPESPGFARGSDTSQAAAEKIEPQLTRLQAIVLKHIRDSGGATRQEIADQTGLKLQTVCGRTRELELAGKVRDSGDRRDGRAVMVAVGKG